MSLAGEEGLKAEHAPDRPVHTWPLDTARKEPRGVADTPTYRGGGGRGVADTPTYRGGALHDVTTESFGRVKLRRVLFCFWGEGGLPFPALLP